VIPLVATVRVRTAAARRPWPLIPLPLVLLWLLLLPIALVLLLPFAVACALVDVNPLRLLGALWGVASALRHTRFEIEQGGTSIRVHLP
jgi:hypothetical protein